MNTVIRFPCLGLLAALLAAAGPPPAAPVAHTATGKGNITFGHDQEGVGYFTFDIAAGAVTTGKLLFAGEHHEHYPDIIVRVNEIDRARFGEGWVRFSATGALHDEVVRVTGRAFDGAGANQPDRFEIKCTNGRGEVVLDAAGELTKGDIVIGTPE